MTKKRKAAAAVLTVLLLANLCFIWGNSLVSRSDSHNLSIGVLSFLPGFVKNLFPNQEQLVHILRKLAHFTEFACLGGLSCGLLATWGKVKPHPFFHLWTGGFLVAAIDETIQIFTGRGSQLQDVWLDFAGFSAGLVLVLVVRAVVLRSKPKETPKEAGNLIAFPAGRLPPNDLSSSGKSCRGRLPTSAFL